MNHLLNVVIITVCIFGLWGGAVWVVESASRIARKLGLSELVIGLTIVAIATSAPEFAVTVSAALKGQSAISVGNVVGSNIFNLGVILGLVALFSTLKTTKALIYRDGIVLILTGVLLLIFFYDLKLEFYEGIVLFTALIIYITVLVKQKQDVDEDVPEGAFKLSDIPKLILGGIIIVTSAHFFVESSSELARLFGISEWLIGVTIVAAGTSAPELATSIVAVTKGKHGISAGNLIGSDIFNMLGVLGIASILRPLGIEQSDYISLIIMVITLLILMVFMRTGWKLTRGEGVLILLIGIARWAIAFMV
ncbi:MAG: calcium/sodium antiporter [Bacteroidetes bacterium]|nr:calcium/sodium antiporter [Bacteroidota bacterium]